MVSRNLMDEAAWQKRITDLCDVLAIKWWHDTDSRRNKSGLPDLILVGNRVLFAELKVRRNRPTAEQTEWINALRNAGQEAVVWWPEQWPSVEKRLRDLSPRRMAAVR